MKIAIIGAGNVGGTLGTAFARHGHEVVFAARDPSSDKLREAVERAPGARAAAVAEAAASADLVVLATPWPSAEQAVRSAGDISGKVLIDCTNPLAPDLSGLVVGQTDSAAESVARWAPGARVVKAFNTTGFKNMADPHYGDQRIDMYVCGDEPAARSTVMRLAEEIGFDPVDCGPLRNARLLEPLAMLWIWLAINGQGPDIAFKLLRR